MLGPDEYIPLATEGVTSVEDLPKPRLEHRSRNHSTRRCGWLFFVGRKPDALLASDARFVMTPLTA